MYVCMYVYMYVCIEHPAKHPSNNIEKHIEIRKNTCIIYVCIYIYIYIGREREREREIQKYVVCRVRKIENLARGLSLGPPACLFMSLFILI